MKPFLSLLSPGTLREAASSGNTTSFWSFCNQTSTSGEHSAIGYGEITLRAQWSKHIFQEDKGHISFGPHINHKCHLIFDEMVLNKFNSGWKITQLLMTVYLFHICAIYLRISHLHNSNKHYNLRKLSAICLWTGTHPTTDDHLILFKHVNRSAMDICYCNQVIICLYIVNKTITIIHYRLV